MALHNPWTMNSSSHMARVDVGIFSVCFSSRAHHSLYVLCLPPPPPLLTSLRIKLPLLQEHCTSRVAFVKASTWPASPSQDFWLSSSCCSRRRSRSSSRSDTADPALDMKRSAGGREGGREVGRAVKVAKGVSEWPRATGVKDKREVTTTRKNEPELK